MNSRARIPHTIVLLAVLVLFGTAACRIVVDRGSNGPVGPTIGEIPMPRDQISDLGPLGSAARALLRGEPFTEIKLEIAFVGDRRPSLSALDHVRDVLSEVTKKPVKVETYRIEGGRSSYSAQQIRNLSSETRRTASEAPTATLWVGYLDGRFRDHDEVVGAAVSATVAAMFPDRFDRLPPTTQRDRVERSALLHEIGHLLALVEIGYESDHDRQDPDHPHHSKNEDSVMHWAVESGGVGLLGGAPPDTFDQADRDDLEKLRSG